MFIAERCREDAAFGCRHPLSRRAHIRISRAEPVYKCAILVLSYFECFSSSFLVGESSFLSFLIFCFAVDSEAIISRKNRKHGKTGIIAISHDRALLELQKCNQHAILFSDSTGFTVKGGITLARELTPSERIDQLRDEKGWKQAELAERIGVNPSQISRIISGNTASISSDILIGLAKEFGVSADYILGLTPVRAPKNSDIAELGLSEVAVRKLLDGSINTDILNRLIEHKDFPFLLKLIQIYFCDTAALGMANRNESIDFMIEMLTDFSQENTEYKDEVKHDQDVLKAQKMKPHEAETEKIKEVLFRMMRDIKQDFENSIPTSPITMAGSMKEMLATIPRDKRKIAKQEIVNYVSKNLEKQCRDLDPGSLELVHDIAERLLAMANTK